MPNLNREFDQPTSTRTQGARLSTPRGGNPMRGLTAGALAGLAATAAMTAFQMAWTAVASRQHEAMRERTGDPARPPREKATVETARQVEAALDLNLPREEREDLATALHFAFGTLAGAAYGAAAEFAPALTRGAGVPYGAGVYFVVNQGVMPAAGLATPATEIPPALHLRGLAAHLVYGLVLETLRAGMTRAWSERTPLADELVRAA